MARETVFFTTVSCTQGVDRVMALAAEDAAALHHGYLGTEHLLLGLVKHRAGAASQVLQRLGVEYPQVFTAVAAHLGRGGNPPQRTPPPSPRVWQVAGGGWAAAQQRGHTSLHTGHFLLSLLGESDTGAVSVLAQLLEAQGADLEAVQTQLDQLWQEGAPPPAAARV